MNTPPPVPDQNPLCRTCGQGALVRRKTFRMSGPVVAIGFVLLIPSVLGMLFGILTLIGIIAATPSQISPSIEKEVRSQLVAQDVPEPIIVKVVANKPVDDSELQTLTPQQVSAVHQAEISSSGQKVSAGGIVLASGLSAFVIVTSFVGGLFGWLLIMRKRILQCSRCGAVVPAS